MTVEQLVKVATCNLNQWSLDFDGNLERTKESIRQAREQGARYRLGPELELSGYGCEDHFLESDTTFHCWESLVDILVSGLTEGILCDIGMPVIHNGCHFNCRVFVLNGRVLLIRPKMWLADDGNYREPRWFTAWKKFRAIEQFTLPPFVAKAIGQRTVPFGHAILVANDTTIGHECCEELFAPDSPHIQLSLLGVEIIGNGSGSHHQLRKLNTRISLIQGATSKGGGVYLYSNQIGCDGGRLYFDGCALVACNGSILAQGSQFSLREVEVVTAVVNLEDVRSARGVVASRCMQAAAAEDVPRIQIDFNLVSPAYTLVPTPPRDVRYHCPEEEIALGPACWLWDYLRRSGCGGYFLPLSGGADSSTTCAIVGHMCQLVVRECAAGNAQVIRDVQRVLGMKGDAVYAPTEARELCNRIFHTCYLGTVNSSHETRDRAAKLAAEVGSYHLSVVIDTIINAIIAFFVLVTSQTPKFKIHGGSATENLALQNIQARMRMVLSYLFAQLLLWVRGRGTGSLLVLGSANVDEGLRGYMTKYDCSSADINPIGGISKMDIQRFLLWAGQHIGYPTLTSVAHAVPTAELEPITENYVQSDEADMGMSYEDLNRFGRLRKVERCGPLSMFEKLRHEWCAPPRNLTPREVADKVKRFFFYYSINRHKMTTLTPSYHAESYAPEDNRYDLRQFLYNAKWSAQFRAIDRTVDEIETAMCPKPLDY